MVLGSTCGEKTAPQPYQDFKTCLKTFYMKLQSQGGIEIRNSIVGEFDPTYWHSEARNIGHQIVFTS